MMARIRGVACNVGIPLCQQLGGHRLAEIMRPFGYSNVGSVSCITTQVRRRIIETLDFAKTIQRMTRYVIKHAT